MQSQFGPEAVAVGLIRQMRTGVGGVMNESCIQPSRGVSISSLLGLAPSCIVFRRVESSDCLFD